MQHFDH